MSLLRVAVVAVLLSSCVLSLALAQSTVPFCYTLNAVPGALYGNWLVTVTGSITYTALSTAPAASGWLATAPGGPWTANLVTAVSATRNYTSASGVSTLSTFSALLPSSYVYSPSGLTLSLNNNNILWLNGAGQWATDANGTAVRIDVTSTYSPLPGNPGLPGFPKTARNNAFSILTITSSADHQVVETAYGPLMIDQDVSAPYSVQPAVQRVATYAPPAGTPLLPAVYNATVTTAVGSSSSCPVIYANTSYISQPFCYILYPHETSQNGMWSIATSGVLYTSTVPYPVQGSASPAIRSGYFIYDIGSVSRTYIDQFGNKSTVTGAVLQGANGDGGTDNILYTAMNSSSSYGGLVDGDGFTFTWLDLVGSLTPGDPTLALGINLYFEIWYREAAEPWHQDEEYSSNTGTYISSFVVGASAPPAAQCVAQTFAAVTPPAGYGVPVQYSFCSVIRADVSAATTVGNWTVVTSGVLSVTSSFFSSFATADSVWYQIGVGITGTRVYTDPTGTVQSNTITGLLQPGGDGQNNNKLYNGSSGAVPFDNGGWSYYVSGTGALLPGVSTPSTIVRLYSTSSYSTISGSNVPNYNAWTEQGLPSFQTDAPSLTSSETYFAYQLLSQGALQCPSGGSSGASTGGNKPTSAAAPSFSLFGSAVAVVFSCLAALLL